jgi:acetyltransferase-like isoleucine patch superfamily enzyme
MASTDGRTIVERLRRQATLWREEPAYRAAVRARLMRPYRVRQFAAFGPGSIVHRPAWLYGTHRIEIGENVVILNGAWLAAERESWEQPEPVITIGDGSGMRAWGTLSAQRRIDIGRDVIFGAGCSVVDTQHTWRAGRPNVLHNPMTAEPIRIGDGTWLGDRVIVLGGANIGERCAIGAGSVVRGEIPDGSVAVGVPARVVGRSAEL